MNPVTVAIVGAGNRGRGYSDYCLQHSGAGRVVAVAEPRADRRGRIARDWGLSEDRQFRGWEELAAHAPIADAVIISTPDGMHAAPGVAFSDQGYAVLMEKPVSADFEECLQVARTMKRNGTVFGVCHVLRYTPYTELLKRLLSEENVLGRVISMQHLEPVGYWHQAHSFVRGNWRNEAGSSPMLLAKSCHDLDWIRYIMEQPCEAVSSFGELTHFRAESAPPGAGWRCLDCAIERECAYSALKIYMERVRAGDLDWPVNVLVEDPDEERVMDALRTGPYGRCVYACDNDVVDHQVVNMRFKGGATASFTMTAFTEARPRETRIFGTAGELFGDGRRCEVFDFMRDERREYDSVDSDGMISTGHGGGDEGIMHAFLQAVAEGDPSLLRSGWKETLESHTMVFAAERARREDRVVQIADYPAV